MSRWIAGGRAASAYEVAVANGFVGTEAAWLASLGRAFQVPPVVGDATTALLEQINAAVAAGGGTVQGYPGHVYEFAGSVPNIPGGVTFDGMYCTLKPDNNAAFTSVDLGEPYNPEADLKPFVTLGGAAAQRHERPGLRRVRIDGNGANQPDAGSYANVWVYNADDALIEDVISVDARPGITINEPVGGANTRRRAFCLLIMDAARTLVTGGSYSNAGYDTIGVRHGAVDTELRGVYSSQAAKGAIQVTYGSNNTRIVGGIWDNTAGGSTESHAVFVHGAVGLTVTGGATMRANTGSCFVAFSTSTDGAATDLRLSGVVMEHSGAAPMVNLSSDYVDRVSISEVSFSKTSTNNLLYASGAIKRLTCARWKGVSTTTSTAFFLAGVSNFEFLDMDTETAAIGNAHYRFDTCTDGRISGGRLVQPQGVGVYTANACARIEVRRLSIKCSDSVQFLGPGTGSDVIDCDLTQVTNANKLRIYGPVSGRVRGNKGAVTEGSGTATVATAATSVTVSHGLWVGTGTTATPRVDRLWTARDFQVSFAGDPGSASRVWISAVTTTQVTFTVDAAPGGSGAPLAWSARMDRDT